MPLDAGEEEEEDFFFEVTDSIKRKGNPKGPVGKVQCGVVVGLSLSLEEILDKNKAAVQVVG